MEYSLRTFLYWIELQSKESINADFIWYKETYPFCDFVEYKKEVLEYLVSNNNNNLNKILKSHLEICDTILEVDKNKLRLDTGGYDSGKYNINAYNMYCTLSKRTYFPFSDLELIRKNNGIYEYGNHFTDNNRFWERYKDIMNDTNEFNTDKWVEFNNNECIIKPNVSNTMTISIISSVSAIRCFINDYISNTNDNEATETDTQQDTKANSDNTDTATQKGDNEKDNIETKTKFTAINVFDFWNEQNNNIFATYSKEQFDGFINSRNLNIYKDKKVNNIKCTINLLAKILGEEWGKETAKNTLNCDLSSCRKQKTYNKKLFNHFHTLFQNI